MIEATTIRSLNLEAASVQIENRISPVDTAAGCAVCKGWIGRVDSDPTRLPGQWSIVGKIGQDPLDSGFRESP